MSERRVTYRPPAPVGDPYRADPRDEPLFPFEGSGEPAPSSAPPVAAPYVLPEGGVVAGQIPPSPTYAEAQARQAEAPQPPVFARPGELPGASAAPQTAVERKARNAFLIGVASLLILHIPLGPIAIVMGVKAYRAGERRNGAWAIGTGVGGTLIGILGVILWATGALPTLDELMKGQR